MSEAAARHTVPRLRPVRAGESRDRLRRWTARNRPPGLVGGLAPECQLEGPVAAQPEPPLSLRRGEQPFGSRRFGGEPAARGREAREGEQPNPLSTDLEGLGDGHQASASFAKRGGGARTRTMSSNESDSSHQARTATPARAPPTALDQAAATASGGTAPKVRVSH